jgi:His-Xaa-Ser system protein HxsD
MIRVDLAVYSLDVVLRTAHAFIGRGEIFVRGIESGSVIVEIEPELERELKDALLDNRLRTLIAEETRTIRELLVAQAFCEADLLDRADIESDEWQDPRRIAG